MEKFSLDIPKGVRYIKELERDYGFHLEEFPYILDKKIPGCGFTTWVLTNSQNIILASPRKMLMENKKDQLKESVFLVKIEGDTSGDNVDKDLNGKSSTREFNSESLNTVVFDRDKLKTELSIYINDRLIKRKPIKIIVTYDSYRKIKEILEDFNLFSEFYTIVDECQSIFCDAVFKSTTELEFIEVLKTVQRVCFVSATPMLEKYLNMMETFRNLPYYEMDWQKLDPTRVIKPKLTIRTLKSINTAVRPYILDYKAGKFEHKVVFNENTGNMENKESRELVIYVNSVKDIIGIIKACDLQPNEVNILCSNTEKNAKKIKTRLTQVRNNKIYRIGKVPTREDPRKMFTLCTRTVYLGADFYSDNARTIILSDANIDTLTVDITLDLPQILGRQRLDENPWKNEAILYIKPIMRHNVLKKEDFDAYIEKKRKSTENLLKSYDITEEGGKLDLVRIFDRNARDYCYKDDYIAVNHHAGSKPIPTYNHLVEISEMRAFEIQQEDYADRFSVFNKILDSKIDLDFTGQSWNVQQLLDKFFKLGGNTAAKLKLLCESELNKAELEIVFKEIPNYFRNFYLGLGKDICKAFGYNYTKLEREYNIKFFDLTLVCNKVFEHFSVGDKIALSDGKQKLKDLYSELGYPKSPKASDLGEYFEMKNIKIKDHSGKWVNGVELLKKKK